MSLQVPADLEIVGERINGVTHNLLADDGHGFPCVVIADSSWTDHDVMDS